MAPSARCGECRAEHRRRKKADYQWALRVERRAQRIDRRRAAGWPDYDEEPVGPRDLTPSWTQTGDEIPSVPDPLDAIVERLETAAAALSEARVLLQQVMSRS